MKLNRRNSILFYVFLVIFVCPTGIVISQQLGNKPNILWIIIEDLSPDLGCYGNNLVKTPNIDGLADQGLRLSNVFATGVACSPSRTAFVTGFYQNYLGAHHMRYPDELKPALPDSIDPIHIHLKEFGYQTANIKSFPGNGKTDWLFKYNTDSYDFEKWEELDSDQPFFARINLRLTHRPFEQDEEYPVNPDEVIVPPYYPDHVVARKDFANYYESIQVMDRQIGKIVEDLKESGLDRNTLIFFFSDHGRPMTRAKNYLYDSGIQVPLIISTLDDNLRLKLGLQGQNESLFSLIDVTATTLGLAGAGSVRTQGISILDEPEGREFVWAAADRIGEIHFKSRMIRNEKYKYIRNYHHDFSVNSTSTAHRKGRHPIYHLLNIMNEKGQLNPDQKKLVEPMVAEELYDVSSDPFELHNLARDPDFSIALDRMLRTLNHFTKEIKDRGMERDSDEIVQVFKKYGEDSNMRNEARILELKRKVFQLVEDDK
ncbi:sulfatase family protein [Membranihabitans maritimus]|uniref:sulfatase family protein n=1 Tax=Membranihabitans maritimus TaxID=2904244 RepID=UPI001F1D6B9A|nr:sulfatase [Membranihabitans maritimus]